MAPTLVVDVSGVSSLYRGLASLFLFFELAYIRKFIEFEAYEAPVGYCHSVERDRDYLYEDFSMVDYYGYGGAVRRCLRYLRDFRSLESLQDG